ncbi:type II toxin-antitoxin system RelE/ParE family toxin [Conexibacter sp. W3-3-2]|uniref:type II toxin-antitoxin system RelE/ParE family toxin n=1 Tax=Conexibacter sp. W3-3-2 TaxID=2675227 RepID=UPI0018A98CEA|nr:type II toxin-antitoxin system RelE/ParE family toxin [Conexibacter sp. W3-3-2]
MGWTQAIYYRDADGVEPVDVFIDELDSALAAAKIDDAIEEHLNGQPEDAPPPPFPITSQIEGPLRELRVRFARTHYRVLYQRSHNLIVLLHAFEKRTGQVSEQDKTTAKDRMADYLEAMNATPKRKPRAAGHDAPPKTRSVER